MAKRQHKVFLTIIGDAVIVYADFDEMLKIKKIHGVDYLEPLENSNVGYRVYLDLRYDRAEVLNEIRALDK